MFSDVLIGVDGHQGGRDAIALAEQLAAPGAEFTLAHVYDWPVWRNTTVASMTEFDQAMGLLSTEQRETAIEAELVAASGRPPGRGLHELAVERAADLLVVGSSRHALLGRALIGDDTRASLNGAPCAIAIAPRGYTQLPHELRSIGVGYDSSPESEQALVAARELASRHGSSVRALWVVSLQDVREERPLPADWPETAESMVGRCRDDLNQLEGIEGDAVYGGPREELSRLSDSVDLLIVGSRGYGPMYRLFHGSVSSYLLGHVACPLLVLPRPVTDEHTPAAEPSIAATA
jgi:nucleotide-binding universal stress UspA family protein